MNIKIVRKVEKSVYKIMRYTELTTTEKDIVKSYGDPDVQVGGVFTGFTLPEALKKMQAGFNPFVQPFDGLELGFDTARERALNYQTVLHERLHQVIDDLREKVDGFNGEFVSTV